MLVGSCATREAIDALYKHRLRHFHPQLNPSRYGVVSLA